MNQATMHAYEEIRAAIGDEAAEEIAYAALDAAQAVSDATEEE